MPERRQLKRYPAHVPVWCEADDFTLYVHTANVSRDGLFVRTSHPLPLNTPFTVVFKELEAVAAVRVSWIRHGVGASQSGMGLEITGFERGENSYLRFIREQDTHGAEMPAPARDPETFD